MVDQKFVGNSDPIVQPTVHPFHWIYSSLLRWNTIERANKLSEESKKSLKTYFYVEIWWMETHTLLFMRYYYIAKNR